MKEQVCILLNEREPHKARAAEMLAARLKEFGITASRQKIDENIVQVMTTKKPRVLVVDYLLGDYSTGLDILAALSVLPPEQRARTFFLTDEPSVPVAVEAMRLGAVDYLELENPQSLARAARQIHEVLKDAKSTGKTECRPWAIPTLDDLIFQSEPTQKLLRALKAAAAKKSGCVVLQGAAGSGLSTLGAALCAEHPEKIVTTVLDLATAGADLPERVQGLLACGGSRQALIVDHAEFDDGTACAQIAALLRQNAAARSGAAAPQVVVLCTDPAGTRPWTQQLGAETIKVPALDQSRNDIPNLVQRFTRECQELTDLKVRHPSAEAVSWLSGLDWPGQIKQLRACVMHALVDGAISETEFRASVEEQREVWEQAQREEQRYHIDPMLAARMLEALRHDYRATAARLGCTVPQLQEVLR